MQPRLPKAKPRTAPNDFSGSATLCCPTARSNHHRPWRGGKASKPCGDRDGSLIRKLPDARLTRVRRREINDRLIVVFGFQNGLNTPVSFSSEPLVIAAPAGRLIAVDRTNSSRINQRCSRQ